MKVIIVDDDKQRAESISSLLIERKLLIKDNVLTVYCADEAKRVLRNVYYDILILDVILPKRNEEVASHQNGLQLLSDITTRRGYKRPEKIIGITANQEDIEEYRNYFLQYCLAIITANFSNEKWKMQLMESIDYTLDSKSHRVISKPTMVVTVHGIMTFGKWQERLKVLVHKRAANVDFQSYKYGYFAPLSFFIPWVRDLEIKKFEQRLKILLNSNPDKTLKIFSHSFGTHIAVKAIELLIKNNQKIPLDLIVLSGSILKSNYSWASIINQSEVTVINECGTSDYVLWVSESLVPCTGMAGKTGFYGLNNSKFINRYHKGGHSLYFDMDDKFMTEHWLPLFDPVDQEVEIIDERTSPHFLYSLMEGLVSKAGMLKGIGYLTICFFVIWKFVLKH